MFVWIFIWRTRWGYAIRAVGLSPKAAVYAGISPQRVIMIAMCLSGALAAGVALNQIIGYHHRLLRTPRVLERLTAELSEGDSEEYIEAVIKETLRVRPVVTEVFRAPNEPIELGGYLFEPGTHTAASILLVQLDPEL